MRQRMHDGCRAISFGFVLCVGFGWTAWSTAGEAAWPLWDSDGLIGCRLVAGEVKLDDGIAIIQSPKVVLLGQHVTSSIRWSGAICSTAPCRLGIGWKVVGRDPTRAADVPQLSWVALPSTNNTWRTIEVELDESAVRIQITDTAMRELRLGRARGAALPCLAVAAEPHRVRVRQVEVTQPRHESLMGDCDRWEASDGQALTNWRLQPDRITCLGGAGPWLRSRSSYQDFALQLEYRLRDGGNSGVYIRVPPDGKHHGVGAGLEVQILDDQAQRYARLKPYQFCGSLYAIAPAWPRAGRPAGEWNALDVLCQGTRYRVIHNGVLVVDADGIAYPKLFERRRSGRIGLQNHRELVEFRTIAVQQWSKSRK